MGCGKDFRKARGDIFVLALNSLLKVLTWIIKSDSLKDI